MPWNIDHPYYADWPVRVGLWLVLLMVGCLMQIGARR